MVPVDQIIPTRKLADHLRRTSKYQSILASIREIGIIEALAAPEAVRLLKDQHIGRGIFGILRKMKALRQIEAAEMMISANLFTNPYAQMILAATRSEQLVNSEKQKPINNVSLEQISRMERELEKVSQDHKLAEETLGENMLTLVVAKGYVSRLLRNKPIADYLRRNHGDLTSELQEVIEAVTADARSVGRE